MPMKLLVQLAMLLPKPIRRRLTDTQVFHRVLKQLTGNKHSHITTPEGQTMAIHPVYHAELTTLGSLANYEPLERQVIGKICRPGMVTYDVGANVGIFACYMSSLVGERGQVIAFEPEANNSACLEATIALNGLRNLRLEKKAVGRVTEKAEFDRRGGAFSGRLVDHGSYKPTSNLSQVDVVCLDDIVHDGSPTPDLIKIDVEGNELLVLEGMRNILKSHPPIVVCEVHSHLGDPAKKVLDLLAHFDYEVFDVEGMAAGKLLPIPSLQGRDWFVACHKSKRDQLIAA